MIAPASHSEPQLTFFCELPADELVRLFADETVLTHLLALRARASLALLDLSDARAAVVRRLTAAGVPVVAWLLLPHDQGYWFNAGNGPQAVAFYARFRRWTAEAGLTWAGIGIDIEPDWRDVTALRAGRLGRLLPRMMGRLWDRERVMRAQAIYSTLLAQMWLDGYRVESYQLPLICDERAAGSTVVQRYLGLVDVPVNREVLMLYTSFTAGWGPAVLHSYGPQADAIGVGSTGGGVDVGLPILTWEQLVRDLRLARRWSHDLFIFSLEGCVRQGFLAPLRHLDWTAPVASPRRTGYVNAARRAGRAGLWLSAHPVVALALGAVTGLLLLRWRRARRSCDRFR